MEDEGVMEKQLTLVQRTQLLLDEKQFLVELFFFFFSKIILCNVIKIQLSNFFIFGIDLIKFLYWVLGVIGIRNREAGPFSLPLVVHFL